MHEFLLSARRDGLTPGDGMRSQTREAGNFGPGASRAWHFHTASTTLCCPLLDVDRHCDLLLHFCHCHDVRRAECEISQYRPQMVRYEGQDMLESPN